MLSAASPAATEGPRRSIEHTAVLAAERALNDSILANDARAIGHATTDDWRMIDSDGNSVSRDEFLTAVASGKLTHSKLMISDETVRVYSDAALVTVRAFSVGTQAGRPFATHEVSTDFFVRTSRGWKCVLTHLTTRQNAN